jgi:hypothetical protein
MTTVELNGELIAEYLDQRELYIGAHMIRRRQDEERGPEPTTYLGLAVAAPEVGGRFGVKPMVTGAQEVAPALPAGGPWAGDPVGDELPLGFSIDELPALGGASEPLRCVEIPHALSRSETGDADGEQ